MTQTDFTFANRRGQQLSGVLETGAGPPRAYALFAHCFTCDKTSLAAVRISRALADLGVGVLRFDFTGLGESEGEFGAGLGADIDDIVSAGAAMAEAGTPVQLLIGHSFGGAAALAAAGSMADVKAVAVVAAPFDPEHVLKHIQSKAQGAAADGRVPVTVGGRAFSLSPDFIANTRSPDLEARIADLGRALLVLHSPVDEVVSIDNATGIFLAARHPKSFVSLDHADHLLKRREDADYAARVIAAWASRYLDAAEPAADTPPKGVHVEETGGGKFQVRVVTASTTFLADEPTSVGGGGAGPTPYDLLSAGLGACTVMTCRLYAERKGWPLERASVEVGHTGKTATSPDLFTRELALQGPLDADQRAQLLQVADRCPVHRTLTEGSHIETVLIDHALPGDAPDQPEDHLRRMEEACDDADGAAAEPPGV